ncbi:MAG TPA: UPF0016 family protein [Gammaproteobacteria bacterium]|nr:UPF0016 family protein [Gammaproteobacteria bacterium]
MDLKMFLTVFAAVFVAELGDKTQLATLLFAADGGVSKLTVFTAASLALIVTSAIGVVAGGFLASHMQTKTLNLLAGSGFVIIGL